MKRNLRIICCIFTATFAFLVILYGLLNGRPGIILWLHLTNPLKSSYERPEELWRKNPSVPHHDLVMNNKTEDVSLIPHDEDLQKMSNDDLMYTYDLYTKALQTTCQKQQPMGKDDGRKYMCVDNHLRPRNNCIVYSFGSNNEFSFEEDIIKTFKCQVFTFDPSTEESMMGKNTKPEGCKYLPIGLGDTNLVNKQGWKINTLDTILSTLNHSNEVIDLLKIDIEIMEWKSFDQMMKTGSLRNVKQILVELHYWDYNFEAKLEHYSGPVQDVKAIYERKKAEYQHFLRVERLGVLRRLYEYGLRSFRCEPNVFCSICSVPVPKYRANVATHKELSFINTSFDKN